MINLTTLSHYKTTAVSDCCSTLTVQPGEKTPPKKQGHKCGHHGNENFDLQDSKLSPVARVACASINNTTWAIFGSGCAPDQTLTLEFSSCAFHLTKQENKRQRMNNIKPLLMLFMEESSRRRWAGWPVVRFRMRRVLNTLPSLWNDWRCLTLRGQSHRNQVISLRCCFALDNSILPWSLNTPRTRQPV